MGTVAALLEQETGPGDAIGLVGVRRTDAIPAGRVVAPSPRAGWESPSRPGFVVATVDEGAPPPSVAALRASADMVLRTPHRGLTVEVDDRTSRGGVETQSAGPAAPVTAGEPDPTAPSPDDVPRDDPPVDSPASTPAAPVPPGAASSTPPATDPDVGPPGSADPAERGSIALASPGEAAVLEGDSFWTIAAATVSAELGDDATDDAVTAYWSALVGASAERLVEPGNADLLHVGQTIVLPPLA